MQLTKFTHSCVRFDDGDRVLVIDPGSFSEIEQALDGVSAVLITHEHADHVDPDRLKSAAKANSSLQIWAPDSVAALLGDLGDQVTTVGVGETFTAGGFSVEAFGGQHALIHPMIPIVSNLGFLLEGVYHPGDSFVVPSKPVSTLLLPVHAPWSKTAEVIDFAIAVRAPKAFAIHDSLLTDVALNMVAGLLGPLAGAHGTEYERLTPLSTVEV